MENSSKFAFRKYAVLFEGKSYNDGVKTYSMTIDIDFTDFMPMWYADSYKAKPLFYEKNTAKELRKTIKTSKNPHIVNFLNAWKPNMDSFRILELGYNDENDFEEFLLNA